MKKTLLALALLLPLAACSSTSSDTTIKQKAENIEAINQNMNKSKTVTKATSKVKETSDKIDTLKSVQ